MIDVNNMIVVQEHGSDESSHIRFEVRPYRESQQGCCHLSDHWHEETAGIDEGSLVSLSMIILRTWSAVTTASERSAPFIFGQSILACEKFALDRLEASRSVRTSVARVKSAPVSTAPLR